MKIKMMENGIVENGMHPNQNSVLVCPLNGLLYTFLGKITEISIYHYKEDHICNLVYGLCAQTTLL